jgi:hypothetical protein
MRAPPPRHPPFAPAAGKIAAKPPKRPRTPPPRGGRPGRPGAVLLPTLPYPVFERTVADAPRGRDEDGAPGRGDDLAWSSPEPLAGAMRPSRPGLFVIERLSEGRWAPVYVGMSSVGAGQALRWIVQAPAIVGIQADWNAFRVRIAEAGFGTTDPAGRAALRRLRDETAAAIESAEGRQVLVGPGPGAAPAAAARSLGAAPPYISRAAPLGTT